MRRLDIGIGLICQGDAYLMQLRGNNPMIGAAGLIGAFGGKLEPEETAAQAVCRELSEETSLTPLLEELEHLGVVEVTADHRLEPVQVFATIFRLPIDERLEVEAKEGTLVRMTKDEIAEKLDLLTPATRACFEQLL